MKRAAIAVTAVALLVGGCSVSGLSLRTDTALTLMMPHDGGRVTMPLTLHWRINDGALRNQLSAGERKLAIFFDRPPMRAGETFHTIADKECRQTPGCPDAAYLSNRSIFVTAAPASFQVPDLPDTRNGHQHDDEHTVTIVVIDGTGHRQGEAAYESEFTVYRPGPLQ